MKKTSTKIDKFVQQNSSVNNGLIRRDCLNELLHTDIDGNRSVRPTEVISRAKRKNKSQVITMCSFSYGDDVDPTVFELKSANRITAFDRRVFNAVCTLYANKRYAHQQSFSSIWYTSLMSTSYNMLLLRKKDLNFKDFRPKMRMISMSISERQQKVIKNIFK